MEVRKIEEIGGLSIGMYICNTVDIPKLYEMWSKR